MASTDAEAISVPRRRASMGAPPRGSRDRSAERRPKPWFEAEERREALYLMTVAQPTRMSTFASVAAEMSVQVFPMISTLVVVPSVL